MAINVVRSKIVLTGVSYTQPVFHASYTQVGVAAEVTMPDVLAVDIVTPADQVYLDAGKTLFDIYSGFVDGEVLHFGKGIFDSPSLLDTAVIGDIQPHRDGIDLATPTDFITGVVFAKHLSDVFELLDEATAVRLFQREFNDILTTPDYDRYVFTPKAKIDVATAVDSSYKGLEKPLYDDLLLVDNMDGDIQHHFIKTSSELISSADLQIIDFKPQKADNIVTASSGILAMQDYCDITYFLADYVGISRQFT